MLNLTKPQYFVPIHGEYRMLTAHANLAKEVGVSPGNVFVLEDGDVLEVLRDRANVSGQIHAGHVYVDGLRQWAADSEVLNERRELARDGVVVVVVKFDPDSGILAAGPTVVSVGFVELPVGLELIDAANKELDYALRQNGQSLVKWADVAVKIESVMGSYLHARTGRRPKIIPVRLHG
jgi:ribonuclease J